MRMAINRCSMPFTCMIISVSLGKHSTISVMLWINSTIPEVKDTVATRTTGRHLLGMYFLLWVSIRFVRECLNMR